ncbi:hypothetical protein MAR_018868 [Mya arenaria]|uniref:Uncharacterized protein n=1 Tax=Mya arenaria TaxID=6604 RepID=A0ABY7EGA2_MYAAR|nr:hypothetical protein MAR_018868 [Mya arenaria]
MIKFKSQDDEANVSEDGTPSPFLIESDISTCHKVGETVGVSRIHSRDGNLHCQKDGKQYTIATPDDLHVLGIEVDLKRL